MAPTAPISIDSFAAAYDRTATSTICPRRTTRLAARLQSKSLDRELIADVDPASCPLLAARAARLTSRRHRAAIASSLDCVLQGSREPGSRIHILPLREAVSAHSEDLRGLAELLRSRVPLYARGLAMLDQLVRDGSGPLYVGSQRALGARLTEADDALMG